MYKTNKEAYFLLSKKFLRADIDDFEDGEMVDVCANSSRNCLTISLSKIYLSGCGPELSSMSCSLRQASFRSRPYHSASSNGITKSAYLRQI
jgi:hypothetical protein